MTKFKLFTNVDLGKDKQTTDQIKLLEKKLTMIEKGRG